MTDDAVKQLLHQTTYRRIDVEPFLDPEGESWSRFDCELGYVPKDVVMADGIGGSLSRYSYEPGGQRRMIHYRDQPCRINTYGDSFTQCQQVSDGETWQEYLAAHLGESIRNFGVGGHGVYQACRRARRVEATDSAADYVILNIFDDDHVRNVDAARWIRSFADVVEPGDKPRMLHGVPWSHLRFDVEQGDFVERPGLCRDESALRDLCDHDHFYKIFKDDSIVQLFVMQRGGEVDRLDELERLAEALGVTVNLRDPATRRTDARRLHQTYGFRSTQHILDGMRMWFEDEGKKLMVMLSYSPENVAHALVGGTRFDQCIIDYLEHHRMAYIDTLPLLAEYYRLFDLSPQQFLRLLYIPPSAAAVFNHYNPSANHWLAHAIKDQLVDWLDPKPPAYLAATH